MITGMMDSYGILRAVIWILRMCIEHYGRAEGLEMMDDLTFKAVMEKARFIK